MRVVTSNELSKFKILPFDLYNEANAKIMDAGEVLTPGKLIMLKNYSKLFTEELFTLGAVTAGVALVRRSAFNMGQGDLRLVPDRSLASKLTDLFEPLLDELTV